MTYRTGLFFSLIILSACSGPVETENNEDLSKQTGDATAAPPFKMATNLHQTMEWILDPAADLIWDSAGCHYYCCGY